MRHTRSVDTVALIVRSIRYNTFSRCARCIINVMVLYCPFINMSQASRSNKPPIIARLHLDPLLTRDFTGQETSLDLRIFPFLLSIAFHVLIYYSAWTSFCLYHRINNFPTKTDVM